MEPTKIVKKYLRQNVFYRKQRAKEEKGLFEQGYIIECEEEVKEKNFNGCAFVFCILTGFLIPIALLMLIPVKFIKVTYIKK